MRMRKEEREGRAREESEYKEGNDEYWGGEL